MRPVSAEPAQAAWWRHVEGCAQRPVVIGGPEEGEDVLPCPALIAEGAGTIHVAYELDELEVAALAQGATLWLTTFGALPVHRLEVQPR